MGWAARATKTSQVPSILMELIPAYCLVCIVTYTQVAIKKQFHMFTTLYSIMLIAVQFVYTNSRTQMYFDVVLSMGRASTSMDLKLTRYEEQC